MPGHADRRLDSHDDQEQPETGDRQQEPGLDDEREHVKDRLYRDQGALDTIMAGHDRWRIDNSDSFWRPR